MDSAKSVTSKCVRVAPARLDAGPVTGHARYNSAQECLHDDQQALLNFGKIGRVLNSHLGDADQMTSNQNLVSSSELLVPVTFDPSSHVPYKWHLCPDLQSLYLEVV